MKNIVYIDGQNFLYKAAEFLIEAGVISDKQELVAIDIDYILHTILPDEKFEARYYGVKKINRRKEYSEEILQKSITFSENLRRTRNFLSKQGIEYVPVGSLKVRLRDECKNCGFVDYKFQEKGVDVGLAVDLVKDSFNPNINKQIIISSDIDLIPALVEIKKHKKETIYIAFAGKKIYSIARETGSYKTISKDLVIEAYTRAIKS